MDRNEERSRLEDELREVRRVLEEVRNEVGKVVLGNAETIDYILAAIICGGHVKLHGIPGVGKTLLLSTMGQVMGLQFTRKQFAADMYPSNIIGGLDKSGTEPVFRYGLIRPLCAESSSDMILADEINSAPQMVTRALLEAMEERTIYVDGIGSAPLSATFTVFATMNPFDERENYSIPAATIHRFMFNLEVCNPTENDLIALAERSSFLVSNADRIASLRKILSREQIVEIRSRIERWRRFVFPEYKARIDGYHMELYIAKILTWFEDEYRRQQQSDDIFKRTLEKPISARSVLRLANIAWFRAIQYPDDRFPFYPLDGHVRDVLMPALAHCIKIASHVERPDQETVSLLSRCVHDMGRMHSYWTPGRNEAW